MVTAGSLVSLFTNYFRAVSVKLVSQTIALGHATTNVALLQEHF